MCAGGRYQASVTVGTILQDSHLPRPTWFRALWDVRTQQSGASALGLGRSKTAWAIRHTRRRTRVRPGRDRRRGTVEVDETYGGREEAGVVGGERGANALLTAPAEADGAGIGRLRRIPDLAKPTPHGFIAQAVEPGSRGRTDGLHAYRELPGAGHDRRIQRRQPEGEPLLPRGHRVVSLLKRWLSGTHPGAIGHEPLDYHRDEFTFRCNRRKAASRGKPFSPLPQQAVQVEPVPFVSVSKHERCYLAAESPCRRVGGFPGCSS